MPSVFKPKELELKSAVAERLDRGKIDLSVYYENIGEEPTLSINKPLAFAYAKELRDLANSIGVSSDHEILSQVLRLPDVISSEKKDPDPEEWKTVLQITSDAIDTFNEFRMSEGSKLLTDLQERVRLIMEYLAKSSVYEEERMQGIRARINRSLEEFATEENIDRNRFEQEMIYYMERLDVTEEKIRLTAHCDYFSATMKHEENQGRKLGFITQEMGREINTLGSKSNHAEMQKLVILMKDELEKIKEQVLNVL
jgi:uncharacterized protein (TIGR00255 family)